MLIRVRYVTETIILNIKVTRLLAVGEYSIGLGRSLFLACVPRHRASCCSKQPKQRHCGREEYPVMTISSAWYPPTASTHSFSPDSSASYAPGNPPMPGNTRFQESDLLHLSQHEEGPATQPRWFFYPPQGCTMLSIH
jgi:hypothetical protein